ncbi:MAG: regulatory protein GemA [Deltaproteobacteria bacterium]|nr:regulatory protein GemA [Deltaproteobacteria bacterium]
MPSQSAKPGPTARQKKLIHWAASLLGLDEDARRAVCWGVCNKTSTLEMSRAEAARVIAEMEKRLRAAGKEIPWAGGGGATPSRDGYPESLKVLGQRRGMASQAQIGKIWGLWSRWRSQPGRREAGSDDLKALNGFLHSRFRVSDVRFLDRRRAMTVIEALVEMVGRG